MPTNPLPCSILVLAGGQGARLGGRDKGLVPWQGKPLVEWVCRTVRPLTDDLIISCNRNHDRYRDYADRLVSDDEPEFPGPLAGICAGLASARHPWLLVMPCDCPLVDADLAVSLFEQGLASPERPVMAKQAGIWQPLFCVIPTRLVAEFEREWVAGARSPREVMLRLNASALQLSANDPRTANLNTPGLLELTDSCACPVEKNGG